MRLDIEEAILRGFIRRERVDRWVALLKSKPRRNKLRGELAHRFEFDGRYMRALSREEDSVQGLYALLRELGAPEDCYLMSEGGYDGSEMELLEALELVYATGTGTVISCVPGKLAYYEGEDWRIILERP